MIKYSFNFTFRLCCEDYTDPARAGADYDSAIATAKAALVPLWNHKQRVPVDYAKDVAPRIHLVVACTGFDRLPIDDDDINAEWLATVISDDLALLRDLRRWSCDQWDEDCDMGVDHPISQAIQETDADLLPSQYANCAACGFSTDRCVEKPDGRFLCVPCDDHENEQA